MGCCLDEWGWSGLSGWLAVVRWGDESGVGGWWTAENKFLGLLKKQKLVLGITLFRLDCEIKESGF